MPTPAHDHHHHHDCGGHGHGGHGAGTSSHNKLLLVFLLTAGYTVAQFIGSYLSGSLALLADSGHMLSDCFSLAVALAAAKIARLQGSKNHTFGYARFEILAALFNGLLLGAVAIYIFNEALYRIVATHPVSGEVMLPFAIGGLLVNILAAMLLHGDHHHNLNVRGAYFHILSDLMGSIGAMLAGILLIAFNWVWADTMISGVIAVLVLSNALRLIRDALRVLMESAPRHLSVAEVREALLALNGVQGIHNLHVWQINSDKIVLTAHLVVAANAYTADTLRAAQDLLTGRFHFNHTTLQLELEP
ncbi:MAG: cation diffusion facilitator family transporter [Vampirovibrionales bacterium]|nr:cation diffusion facilitator family transporter [Vampirovibrionales bacterium]